ncbi:Nitrate reductase delta subunit [Enhygromyxa salina]|uniref:Nitrate reductase delta subunit n=1 Tax=Enhygromyxa salina TaxID=215803 RepID=A0A2S9YBR0_9BACT|nr:molecular chaperone TorD family protein [Enhygromyxa salina]PRQ02558.1 Nitrate reductase delta subunit [Enhygromyxa salina]
MTLAQDPSQDPRVLALAYSRLYAVLARALLRGVDARMLAQLRELDWVGPGDGLEQLATQLHATFELGVFPYAGVFLDPDAQAGACADRVRGFYARAGFSPRPVNAELAPDHLGVELAFMAFVSRAHADGRLGPSSPLLAEFLDACVLAYLPSLVIAARELGEGAWPTMLNELLELVAAQRATLPGPRAAPSLCPAQALLDDARTGLREIAAYLLTPARSGVFLTRADIAALARSRGLARGFGSRLTMLDNLLRGAVEYGELDKLRAGLDELLARRDHRLVELDQRLELGPAIEPWRAAIARTRELVRALHRAPSRDRADPWTSKPSTTTPPAP